MPATSYRHVRNHGRGNASETTNGSRTAEVTEDPLEANLAPLVLCR